MEHAMKELGPIAVHQAGYLWLIPLFPLVGATTNAHAGWKLQKVFGKRAVHLVAVGVMVASLLVAVRAFAQLWALDPLGMMMVLIITLVGTLIHVFSVGYMADEPSYWRFVAWLNLFVFSMLLLVMGDNLVLMFFGWEGVGLCSYGLISYYYTDREKAAAGMKAFVVNRFGDFGFLVGLLLLFWGLGGAWA